VVRPTIEPWSKLESKALERKVNMGQLSAKEKLGHVFVRNNRNELKKSTGLIFAPITSILKP